MCEDEFKITEQRKRKRKRSSLLGPVFTLPFNLFIFFIVLLSH